MGLWDPVRREHVIAATREYDELGQSRFLDKYGFGPARAYQLIVNGRSYDSKAVLGAAYGFATGSPLPSQKFHGGTGYNGAASTLQRLGFEVIKTADTNITRNRRTAPACFEPTPADQRDSVVAPDEEAADVLLVGCVKRKRDVAAPASELYVSPLYRKRRGYAEASGRPWYILSALHGLVHPDRTLEPYDMNLAHQTSAYRDEWAQRVARDLQRELGSLTGKSIEIHAGSSYVDPLRPLLHTAGAAVRVPLRGLTQGEHLAWYRDHRPPAKPSKDDVDVETSAAEAIRVLTTSEPAPAGLFPWGRTDLHNAGLYAWWVDQYGAADLVIAASGGLTLVYAGQAGGTRWPTGIRSEATLFSRIKQQHLSGRISTSTLRQTFAALLQGPLELRLAAPGTLAPASEGRLSEWMRTHLFVTVWPTPNRDELRSIEERVIDKLDAPLNLAGARKTDLRSRLTAGRKSLQLPPQ